MKRVRELICCCCGTIVKGRQWYNRDNGYGVCMKCVEYAKSKDEDIKSLYGINGIHYNIK